MSILKIVFLSLLFSCSFANLSHYCQDLGDHRNVKLLPKPPTCGSVQPVRKIMGGLDAQEGEFPWMVTLNRAKFSDWGIRQKICDGVIVTSRYVLTAAHCVHDLVDRAEYYMYIKLEQHKLIEVSRNVLKEVPVKHSLTHPEYENITQKNDIALLHLTKNITFNSRVYPICLPFTCDILELNLTNKHLVLAGWGLIQGRPVPQYADVLQKVAMKGVSAADCRKSWAALTTIDPHMQLCVRGESGFLQSACRGDSGGPLMLAHRQHIYVVGVVSMGDTCTPYDPSENPNIFTRVAAYTKWILDTIT